MSKFGNIGGYTPEIVEDNSSDGVFKALNGKYKAVVKEFNRIQGSKGEGEDAFSWDFISVRFQVTETVSGTKGDKRYLDKQYSLKDNDYTTAEEELKKFLNACYTITKEEPSFDPQEGDDDETVIGKALQAADVMVGKLASLTVYPNKNKTTGQVRVDKQGNEKMVVIVVAEHKAKGTKKEATKDKVVEGEF